MVVRTAAVIGHLLCVPDTLHLPTAVLSTVLEVCLVEKQTGRIKEFFSNPVCASGPPLGVDIQRSPSGH